MREIAPDYYPRFRCIAHACRHSCCVGWEIDVDDESLQKYLAMPGALGDELRAVIAADGDTAHFRLAEDERCPFLNEDGLCRLILAEGEDILCQICRDHPRFRSEFSHVTEIGLGLCCEAAARLVLTQEKSMEFIVLSDDGGSGIPDEEEVSLLTLRAQLLGLLEDESWSVEERLTNILDLCGAVIPQKTDEEWAAVYRVLERLDDAWDTALDTLTLPKNALDASWDRPFLNLAAYFLYRHLPGALYDGAPHAHAAFAVLSTRIIRSLFAAAKTRDMDTLTELARLYSSEIEYSEENTDALLDLLCC